MGARLTGACRQIIFILPNEYKPNEYNLLVLDLDIDTTVLSSPICVSTHALPSPICLVASLVGLGEWDKRSRILPVCTQSVKFLLLFCQSGKTRCSVFYSLM